MKWTYLIRTIANIEDQLQLREVIKMSRQQYSEAVAELEVKLSNNMKRALQVSTEKGEHQAGSPPYP